MDLFGIDVFLLSIIFLCFAIPTIVGIIYYRNYKKAKKSWKVLYSTEIDMLENMKYNLRKNKEFLAIMVLFAISSIFIISMSIYTIILLLIVFSFEKLRMRKIDICDKGILLNGGMEYWKNFEGYKKNGDYIY